MESNEKQNGLEGQLVKTITADGLELQGFWKSRKSDTAVFHSHGTSGDFYTHRFIEVEGRTLSREGISFLSANNRGHDVYADLRRHRNGKVDWVQIGGAFERFEDCLLDIAAWLEFLEKQGVKGVILQAHSLSQKLVYYQYMKKDPRVVAQIHLSPCNDAGFMYFTLGKEKYEQINQRVKEMVESGREREMLPKEWAVVCPMAAQAYFGYLTEEGIGNIFPYHDPESVKWGMLSAIKDPLLAVFGEADGFIKPSIGQAAKLFEEKAKTAKRISVKIIPKAPHSYVGHEEELVTEIMKWIKAENVINKEERKKDGAK